MAKKKKKTESEEEEIPEETEVSEEELEVLEESGEDDDESEEEEEDESEDEESTDEPKSDEIEDKKEALLIKEFKKKKRVPNDINTQRSLGLKLDYFKNDLRYGTFDEDVQFKKFAKKRGASTKPQRIKRFYNKQAVLKHQDAQGRIITRTVKVGTSLLMPGFANDLERIGMYRDDITSKSKWKNGFPNFMSNTMADSIYNVNYNMTLSGYLYLMYQAKVEDVDMAKFRAVLRRSGYKENEIMSVVTFQMLVETYIDAHSRVERVTDLVGLIRDKIDLIFTFNKKQNPLIRVNYGKRMQYIEVKRLDNSTIISSVLYAVRELIVAKKYVQSVTIIGAPLPQTSIAAMNESLEELIKDFYAMWDEYKSEGSLKAKGKTYKSGALTKDTLLDTMTFEIGTEDEGSLKCSMKCVEITAITPDIDFTAQDLFNLDYWAKTEEDAE